MHEQEGQKQFLRATTSTNVSVLRASYLVANRIAKAKKPFTIGEELILPATKDICRELLGEAAVKKIAQVPLSASTVTLRIEKIAEDIETQLLERINTSPWYALQVDESTDIDNKTILLVYVRYLYQEDVHEDMLCALSLPTKTTAAELFKSLDDYISGKLKWSFCVGICTDGAAAMTGRLSGLTTRIKEVAPEWILEETEPDLSFSQMLLDHLSLLLKEFERDFPTTKDPRTAKEWIRDPFVNKPEARKLNIEALTAGYAHSSRILVRGLTAQQKLTTASLKALWVLAKHNRPFTDAEVFKKVMVTVLEELATDKSMDGVIASVKQVSLSARSAIRCIEALSDAVQGVIIKGLSQANYFSLAIDESSDSTDVAQLCVYVRYF
ncbi:hypothetical protein JOQ06_027077 [Pogonophryne albipinna]|uniref:DUF4371 domain-containing protein n=1 Tax=Pogonophryne albipinna TaxID=1090488 RepID=A0AAD6BBC7_9TELE|nr:hypothetical protein JOQ06_027077 [Pogonophryne albipinna]